jgi:glycosyltransferase involved in cell wall biosynthesis
VDHLAGVLESVRLQTYARIEHIVIDGGSTDGSIELLQAAEKELGIRWLSEPDSGMYNAVNKGLELATGEIVAYLNSDDRYFPYSVEVAVAALSSSDIGFVFGDMLNYDESKCEGSVIFYPPFSKRYLQAGGFIGQPTVFWRAFASREIGGFDESLRLAADHEYWRRMAARFDGRKVHDVLAYEEEHPGRLTFGEAAHQKGTAELRSVRRSHFGNERPGFASRFVGLLHRAYWQRALTLGFLLSRRRRAPVPGRAWGGFHLSKDFEVRVSTALLGLVPVLGRRFKRSVVRR